MYRVEIYNDLLANGVPEEIANLLSTYKSGPEKKEKKKGNGWFGGSKESLHQEVIIRCSVCGHETSKVREVKKKIGPKVIELRTCSHCPDFLLDLEHKELVSLTTLANHPDKFFSIIPLGQAICLAKKKNGLEWFLTNVPITSNIPDEAKTKEEVKQAIAEVDTEKLLEKMIASGIPEDLAISTIKAMQPPKKRKAKVITKKEVIITKTCTLCKTEVGFKKKVAVLNEDDLFQACNVLMCENCIRLFEQMTSEQLVSLLLIQNSRDVMVRLLTVSEQITLAKVITPKNVWNYHI